MTPRKKSAEVADVGRVPIDTGSLLMVDPCHLPDDIVTALLKSGVALLLDTPSGDCWASVSSVTEPGDGGGFLGESVLIVDDGRDWALRPWTRVTAEEWAKLVESAGDRAGDAEWLAAAAAYLARSAATV